MELLQAFSTDLLSSSFLTGMDEVAIPMWQGLQGKRVQVAIRVCYRTETKYSELKRWCYVDLP